MQRKILQVVQRIKENSKNVVFAASVRRGLPLSELGLVTFAPPDRGEWLMVVKYVNRKGDSSGGIQLVDFPDMINCVFL